MKAIMISIKPKWCAKIMNGEKTIEVRKNKALATAIQKLIDENGYAEIYVYCSKGEPFLHYDYNKYGREVLCHNEKTFGSSPLLNGKVIFKFRCYKMEEILIKPNGNYYTNTLSNNKLLTQSCLSQKEILEYAGSHISKISGCWFCGYAIHISNLEIFDRPKELSEFKHFGKTIDWCLFPLERAPQNFCYVEVE